MTDKFKDQDSMLPAATDDKKKAIVAKTGGKTQVVINPPEKVDPQRGYNEHFKQALEKHSVILEKKTELVLQSKAQRAEFPQDVIEQVYKRGFKSLPLNTELTREQYAMNRVNSFIAGGAAMVEDCDLLPIMERIGMKGTGGAMRPHIKREKSVYNGKTLFHVVDAKGNIKHTTNDEFAAKQHLAQKYNSYMGESFLDALKSKPQKPKIVAKSSEIRKFFSNDTPNRGEKYKFSTTDKNKDQARKVYVRSEGTLSPMKRFEGTKSLVNVYKDDTPGQSKKDVAEGKPDQLPTQGADYSKYDTDHLKTLLKPGILHRNEARFKALIRKELQKRQQQGVAESKDPGEYDREGEMAKGQLRTIIANAQRAHDMLKDDTNMAEWVQSKITLAADYVSTVADYMQSQIDEETKKGLYYYINRRKKLGISRDKDNPKAPSAQDWKNAAKTAKEEVDLSELSNAVLARYKAKAGEQATAADKAGDFKKGSKRFSGIIKATNKQFDNDAKGNK